MIYKLLIDPMLSGLRARVKTQIEAGSTCIDMACGTGDMVFRLMDHCSQVTGVDRNQKLIAKAQRKVNIKGLDHLRFLEGDVTHLDEIATSQYDYALVSLAIHQFDPELRMKVIHEAVRISKTVLVADYTAPAPNSAAGYLARFIEFLAGKEHYTNYRDYQSKGGVPGLMNNTDMACDFAGQSNSVFSVFRITSKKSG